MRDFEALRRQKEAVIERQRWTGSAKPTLASLRELMNDPDATFTEGT